ncbi:diguanylate cyclase [Acidovorax temperans]|uniref:sensor domain-containing diguanylate cyclase n=1 Tax=Acidovorax temperans TaxID=80878 RepID=UPI00289FAE2A|nr:diguanylate cyclase [Acidovorax temperans]
MAVTKPSSTVFDKRRLLRRFASEWLVYLAIMTFIGGLLWWMWASDRDAVEQRETERLRAAATVIERKTIRKLETGNRALQGFMNRLDAWQKSPTTWADASAYLEAVADSNPDFTLLFFLDAKGTVLASSGEGKSNLGRDFSQRPYFQSVKRQPAADTLYVSEPFQTLRGRYAINLVRALVGPDGELRGVVVAGLEPQTLRTFLNSTLYADDMWVSIAHGNGVQLMMEPDKAGQSGLQLNRPGSLFEKHTVNGGRETVAKGVTMGTGQFRFTVLRTVRLPALKMDAGLVLAVSREHDAVFHSSEKLRQNFALIFLIMALGAAGSLSLNQSIRFAAKQSAAQARQELEERDETLRRFFLLNQDLFAIVDETGHYTRVNEAWSALLGYSQDQIVGNPVGQVAHPDDRGKVDDYRQRLTEGMPVGGVVTRVRHVQGHYLDIEWRVLHAGDQVFLNGRDVSREKANMREMEKVNTQLAEQKLALQEMAFHDGLTGVFNRRYFDEVLHAEWRGCAREGKVIAVLLLDIDHFKLYNDTYGHLQGDECLKHVATELQNRFKRPRDFVARYGGEEFVALLSDTDEKGALHKANEVVQAIAAMHIKHEKSPVQPYVTVSVGVAVVTPNLVDLPESLVQRADAVLYEAKSTGRNRAVLAEGPTSIA